MRAFFLKKNPSWNGGVGFPPVTIYLLTYDRLISVTITRARSVTQEIAREICLDYTVTGLDTMSQLSRGSKSKPFRFIYTSGAKSERDPSKSPWFMRDYLLLRVSPPPSVLQTS